MTRGGNSSFWEEIVRFVQVKFLLLTRVLVVVTLVHLVLSGCTVQYFGLRRMGGKVLKEKLDVCIPFFSRIVAQFSSRTLSEHTSCIFTTLLMYMSMRLPGLRRFPLPTI